MRKKLNYTNDAYYNFFESKRYKRFFKKIKSLQINDTIISGLYLNKLNSVKCFIPFNKLKINGIIKSNIYASKNINNLTFETFKYIDLRCNKGLFSFYNNFNLVYYVCIYKYVVVITYLKIICFYKKIT